MVNSSLDGLVPKFDKGHVTEFFLHFEMVPEDNKWPKEQWSTPVQFLLVKHSGPMILSVYMVPQIMKNTSFAHK